MDMTDLLVRNFNVKKLFPLLLLLSTFIFLILVHMTSNRNTSPASFTRDSKRQNTLQIGSYDLAVHSGDVDYQMEQRTAGNGDTAQEQRPVRNSFDININLNVTINDLPKAVMTIIKELRQLTQGADQPLAQASMQHVGQVYTRFIPNIPTADNSECLLTLFTTWGKSGKAAVHENTLRNWARFKPIVRPVLFVEDAVGVKQAINAGWDILPITKKADINLPILKNMFLDAKQAFHSKFYGFANADILFTDSLVNSLTAIIYNTSINQGLTFITGVRTNVLNMTVEEAGNWANITKAAQARGKYFQSSAEDYFITGSSYPWSDIPELVVGSLAYDNWLVLSARAKKHNVIDGTKSVLAVHQTVNERDTYQSHFRDGANYNANLLKGLLYDISPPYHRGFTECTELYTDVADGQIIIKRRGIPGYCKS